MNFNVKKFQHFKLLNSRVHSSFWEPTRLEDAGRYKIEGLINWIAMIVESQLVYAEPDTPDWMNYTSQDQILHLATPIENAGL